MKIIDRSQDSLERGLIAIEEARNECFYLYIPFTDFIDNHLWLALQKIKDGKVRWIIY